MQPGNPRFSLLQRGGAVVRNGSKLAAVGFFASLLGVGVTNGMVALRTSLDPTFVPLNAPQDVLVRPPGGTSLSWGGGGTSSTCRADERHRRVAAGMDGLRPGW